MKIILVLLCSLTILSAIAQSKDSIATNKDSKLTYKPLIVPALLIGGGFALLHTQANENLQPKLRSILGTSFHTNADSFLQYEAVLQIYGGRYLGFTPKNDLLHQTINIVIANAIMGTAVEVMKHEYKVERPDFSDHYSFPSGHTGMAFTNATLLFYEYKDANIWYASSGFLFATATGFFKNCQQQTPNFGCFRRRRNWHGSWNFSFLLVAFQIVYFCKKQSPRLSVPTNGKQLWHRPSNSKLKNNFSSVCILER